MLAEECSVIIQSKIPPKLNNPCQIIIPYIIGPLTIWQVLCHLGANINLITLSMTRKLNYGEPKPTRMNLTLATRSITYPYGVLEDVLVRVDGLLFPVNFVILDMP